MKVAVVGTGYVGLITGTCLADLGHHVICIDNDRSKISLLKKGKIPIYEPDLEPLLKKNVKAGRLHFSNRIQEGVEKSQVIFIAVNTPPMASGEADLSYVAYVAREIAEHLKSYRVIVDKSTVPVKTGHKVSETIQRYCKKGVEFDIVSNPEFLREGSAVQDMFHPDRIVVGVSNPRAAQIMRQLYEPIKTKFIVTDVSSAELIKHASNSFLAMKISFANALANICELSGADVEQVVYGMGMDHRVGAHFLKAGIGYGGSCFPKDVSAFIKISEDLGYPFHLLEAVEEINEDQKARFVKKVKDVLWVCKGKTIGVLGLSFKPNTDDMRNAPSLSIIHELLKEGAKIKAYDPQAMDKTKNLLKKIQFCRDPYQVAKGSDALLILTEWEEFKKINYKKIREIMTTPIVVDGRNLLHSQEMNEMGFVYKSVGRS
ncbi:MAG: UDP-glucose/GDP-mannose dehydrogenase family protein [Chlamydiae bacterium]|nr:UDP-glucose/GDP-mannose dehydrogenase family protein [Chlamydiota bacterium]MBI3265915.1 UDP-glucose/GDP-mannose dehydrogenase family protein [Chlamydiota bacterium]